MKITFEQWKNHFVDVPFIEENYDLLESMEVSIESIIHSQDTSDGKTKFVRVFTFGSWYEILENGDHYFMHPYLGDKEYDYIGIDEEEIEKNLKDLFEYVTRKENYSCAILNSSSRIIQQRKLETNFTKNNLF